MFNTLSKQLRHGLRVLAALLIVKVTLEVLLNYGNYVPANFASDFLRGREPYFYHGYHWAFYAHIVSGPLSLLLGTLLVSEQFRLRFPAWHRRMGQIQIACVLFLVAPSGLWMARYAASGTVGGIGLAALAIATGASVSLGWNAALKRRFVDHRRWMWRTYLLLCSAVVIRLIGGFATVFGVTATWLDSLTSWLSWIAPVAIYELRNRRTPRLVAQLKKVLEWDQSSSRIESSPPEIEMITRR